MTTSLFSQFDTSKFGKIGGLSISKSIEDEGRFPPVTLVIKPLDKVDKDKSGGGLIKSAISVQNLTIDRFLSYHFSSSILVPVDTFSFEFVAPDGPPLPELIKEGDIAVISANDVTIATGIIDLTEVETDALSGEKGSVSGRDLMSQLEDQDAVSMDSSPIWANKFSVLNGVRKLLDNTRITNVVGRDLPTSNYLLATEPGESKLAALQRFLEPLNSVAWCAADGTLLVGKPNMSQKAKGSLILNKEKRISNVLSMRVTRNSTTIPNAIVPIWVGQETVVDRVPKSQVLLNGADGPSRLFKLGHRVPKSVVVSNPNATDPQGLSSINAIKAGGSNLLQSYAKRELARQNVRELIVQVVVPGHFNEEGEPFVTDTVYYIEYDRGKVFENMFLYQCDYELTESRGQITNLWFCKLGTIVADTRAP